MGFAGMQSFIRALEQAGELKRIQIKVDPYLEIAEITDRISKADGPALLFENTGFDFPVLINSLGSEKRMCIALGTKTLDDTASEIEELFLQLTAPKNSMLEKLKLLPTLGKIGSWMPKQKRGRGACQQVVMKDPDLTKLPVMTCWPHDGGPFMTLPIIHTKDIAQGVRNVGLYRMQVFGPKLAALHWHRHKVSAGHFRGYQEAGKRMPVAVALGGDPIYSYVATAPLPPNVDEYILAGFIRKKRVDLVKCLTNELYVPADADIIIEGYTDPDEEFIYEGPFGDHTGYYSLADYYPKFHVTAITHRKDAVYPSTIVGIPPQEDAWIGKATERIFLAPIRMTMLPEMDDMALPIEGVFHNLTIVKIKKEFPGHGQKVMNAMWGAGQMMFNKVLLATDQTIDIHDPLAVARGVSQNVDPAEDMFFGKGAMDVLDHSCSKFAFGGKMFIDATSKLPEEVQSNKAYQCPTSTEIQVEAILGLHQAIRAVGTTLLDLGVSAVSLSMDKIPASELRELADQLVNVGGLDRVKFIFICEPMVDPNDMADVTWRISNNIDPVRDVWTLPGDYCHHALFDGTRKTPVHDNFDRPWPNIIAADEATMDKVDAQWEKYQLGPLLPSPSRKYAKQLYPGKAVAE